MTRTGDQLGAPWSQAQVTARNDFQANPANKPYPCKNEGCRPSVAAKRGWVCPDCAALNTAAASRHTLSFYDLQIPYPPPEDDWMP